MPGSGARISRKPCASTDRRSTGCSAKRGVSSSRTRARARRCDGPRRLGGPDLQPLLERGLLAHEVEASGFSIDPGLVATPPSKRKAAAARPVRDAREERRAKEAARARLRAAKEELAEAKRAAAAARKELGRAEREAKRTADAVAKAEQAVEQAEEEL